MMEEVTQQEGSGLTERLRRLADQWRERMAEPAMQQQIQAGTIQIDPLVTDLLKLFPQS